MLHAFSNGVIRFVPSINSQNTFLNNGNSLTVNENCQFYGRIKMKLHHKKGYEQLSQKTIFRGHFGAWKDVLNVLLQFLELYENQKLATQKKL